jgi:RimJ/RimL family protein N-acetyltransferase
MDEIVAICRDPDVQAWTTIPADYTRTDAEAWLRHTAGGWERCQEFGFVGVDETTGAIVGTVGVRAVRADRRIADIGYTVGPRFRGREIAPHMVRLVRAWTLGVWPVERFQIHVYVGNTRSERVAEKCGFQREGVLRRYGDQRGVLRDAVMFSWLPGEG